MALLCAFTIKHIQKPLSSASSHPKLSARISRVTACAHNKFDKQQAYWTSIHSDVATSLGEAFPLHSKLSKILGCNPFRYSVLSTPMTLAPLLCVAASELVSGQRETAMPTACALHIMHAALEAHRRMPPLFDIPIEQGKASTHVAFGNNIALLTSDALMPYAYEHIATASGLLGGRALRVIAELAEAVGAQGKIAGLYYEMGNAPAKGAQSELEQASIMIEKKATLVECGCTCGGILGGGSEGEIESLRRFGKYVGMLHEVLQCLGKGEKLIRAASVVGCAPRDKTLEVAEELRINVESELVAFDEDKVVALYSLLDHVVDDLIFKEL